MSNGLGAISRSPRKKPSQGPFATCWRAVYGIDALRLATSLTHSYHMHLQNAGHAPGRAVRVGT